jgi:hypothetical protein
VCLLAATAAIYAKTVTTPDPAGSAEQPATPAVAAPATAPVEAIDNDGVGATTAGTVVWFAALVITSLSYKWLHEHGWEWAIGTSALGFAFGLFGVWYTVRRRSAYRAAAALGDPRVAKQN